MTASFVAGLPSLGRTFDRRLFLAGHPASNVLDVVPAEPAVATQGDYARE